MSTMKIIYNTIIQYINRVSIEKNKQIQKIKETMNTIKDF